MFGCGEGGHAGGRREGGGREGGEGGGREEGRRKKGLTEMFGESNQATSHVYRRRNKKKNVYHIGLHVLLI